MASGQVVNLISNDVNRFDIMCIFLHYMWAAPLVTTVIVFLFWRDGGLPALFGFSVAFLITIAQCEYWNFIHSISVIYFFGSVGKLDVITIIFACSIVTAYIGKLSSKFRRLIALRTDERVRLVNEVISGIQVIKMYAWEKPFFNLMKTARK